jgi:phage baseplate assembly protein W
MVSLPSAMSALLGTGWRFPVDTNRNGGVATSSGEELIRESIAIILGTAPGERVMRPHFGCDIHELLFAPNNANTAGLAAHYCVEALQKWEPRIAEIEADAAPSTEEPHKLLIHIRYKVRETGTTHNLVYPFYLRKEE